MMVSTTVTAAIITRHLTKLESKLNTSDHVMGYAIENRMITDKDRRAIEKAEDRDRARIFLEKVQVSGGEQWFNLLVTALQESVTLGNTELGDLLQKDYDTELSRLEVRESQAVIPAEAAPFSSGATSSRSSQHVQHRSTSASLYHDADRSSHHGTANFNIQQPPVDSGLYPGSRLHSQSSQPIAGIDIVSAFYVIDSTLRDSHLLGYLGMEFHQDACSRLYAMKWICDVHMSYDHNRPPVDHICPVHLDHSFQRLDAVLVDKLRTPTVVMDMVQDAISFLKKLREKLVDAFMNHWRESQERDMSGRALQSWSVPAEHTGGNSESSSRELVRASCPHREEAGVLTSAIVVSAAPPASVYACDTAAQGSPKLHQQTKSRYENHQPDSNTRNTNSTQCQDRVSPSTSATTIEANDQQDSRPIHSTPVGDEVAPLPADSSFTTVMEATSQSNASDISSGQCSTGQRDIEDGMDQLSLSAEGTADLQNTSASGTASVQPSHRHFLKSKSHPATRTSDSSLDASLQYNSYDAPTPLAQPTNNRQGTPNYTAPVQVQAQGGGGTVISPWFDRQRPFTDSVQAIQNRNTGTSAIQESGLPAAKGSMPHPYEQQQNILGLEDQVTGYFYIPNDFDSEDYHVGLKPLLEKGISHADIAEVEYEKRQKDGEMKKIFLFTLRNWDKLEPLVDKGLLIQGQHVEVVVDERVKCILRVKGCTAGIIEEHVKKALLRFGRVVGLPERICVAGCSVPTRTFMVTMLVKADSELFDKETNRDPIKHRQHLLTVEMIKVINTQST